jgi:hypothetical protein
VNAQRHRPVSSCVRNSERLAIPDALHPSLEKQIPHARAESDSAADFIGLAEDICGLAEDRLTRPNLAKALCVAQSELEALMFGLPTAAYRKATSRGKDQSAKMRAIYLA